MFNEAIIAIKLSNPASSFPTISCIFLPEQSFLPAVNALLLGYLFYKSRLVPRVLPLIGFVGAALLIAADIAVLFGLIRQRDPSTALAAIPIALWEFSLGIYLLVKGFKPRPGSC